MRRVQEGRRQTGINPLLPFHVLWWRGSVTTLFNLQRARRSAGVYLHSSGIEGPWLVLGIHSVCLCRACFCFEETKWPEREEEEKDLEVPTSCRRCRSVGPVLYPQNRFPPWGILASATQVSAMQLYLPVFSSEKPLQNWLNFVPKDLLTIVFYVSY